MHPRPTLLLATSAFLFLWGGIGSTPAQTVQLPPPAASSLDRLAQTPSSPYGYPLSPPPPAWDPYGPQASQIYPVPATNPAATPAAVTNPTPTWATSAVTGQPGYPGYSTAPPAIVPSNPPPTIPAGYPQPPTQQSEWFQQTYQQTLQVYQGARGSWTYIMGNGEGTRVAVNELDTSASFALPFFMNSQANLNKAPLLITPGFGLQLWQGPQTNVTSAELPANTYDVFLDSAWNPQFTPLFGAEFGIRVGFYTNWDVFVTDSWRIMGRAIGTLRMTPTFQGKLGVIYLDRNQVKLLPAVGFTWTPNDTSRYDIFFPAPRASWRFGQTSRHAWWGYVAGEYGGGAWTFRRRQNTTEITRFDYNDIRISLGTEWTPLAPTGLAGNFELGYVFYRQLFYVNGPGPQIVDLPSSIMFRLGLAY